MSASWSPAATEHLNQADHGWEDCCRFFLLDPEKNKNSDIRTKIHGMSTGFYPFQVFGIFVMFEMEMWQGGGYLADDMGLGKVRSLVPSFTKATEQDSRPLKLWV